MSHKHYLPSGNDVSANGDWSGPIEFRGAPTLTDCVEVVLAAMIDDSIELAEESLLESAADLLSLAVRLREFIAARELDG